ncbi:MAG: amidohydrolase family protein [Methanomassiliicoccaceae archaeon]|jgi:5-methylthioadenosine/S-adenosylhomocysteine deaminase|nr:amidohydrolase family protein [Methanomassiliicoccaceae archaeon]
MITVIRGARIVTQDASRRIIEGDVVVKDERIISAGPVFKGSADTEIDASGDIVMPGLINTHTHVAMSVMKGMADDLRFPDFLDRVFAIDRDRTDNDIAIGTKLGCAEMIRSGTTTFVDLYYSEDVIAKATEEAGIRGILCWCVLDEQFTTQKGNPLDNCRRFCGSHKKMRKSRPGVGLQGVYVCSEDTCKGAKRLSDELKVPLHFHLSETRSEVNEHKRKTGRRPAEWLNDIGVLSERSIAAHSAWLTMNEVRTMGKTGMSIASCPVSNMKLATGGVAPIPELTENSVNVSLGTDGSTTNNSLDMFSEMKILGLLQKSSRWDASVTNAQTLLDIATVNGAGAIGMGKDLGSIEPGKYADIIILDGKAPNLRPLLPENTISNIVYSANALNVKTVICQGDIVMKDRKIKTLNERKVIDASEGVQRVLRGNI